MLSDVIFDLTKEFEHNRGDRWSHRNKIIDVVLILSIFTRGDPISVYIPYVYVCMRARARARACVCVCVCVRARNFSSSSRERARSAGTDQRIAAVETKPRNKPPVDTRLKQTTLAKK